MKTPIKFMLLLYHEQCILRYKKIFRNTEKITKKVCRSLFHQNSLPVIYGTTDYIKPFE